MDNAQVLHGDCLEVLRGMADESVDSIVTDPPYGLSFMGKRWDYDVPSVEIWAECLRVLKPGGHLLAFAGTRTQHRMAVRIEDAGFEIRDLIAWVYSTGFPKSHNIDNHRGNVICGCASHALPYTHAEQVSREQKTERDLHSVRGTDVSQAVDTCEGTGEILQSCLPEQGASEHGSARTKPGAAGGEQSCMEGWRNAAASQGQLCSGSIHQGTGMGATDGAQGWVSDGTSGRHGEGLRIPADADGVRAPSGSQPAEQSTGQLGTVAGQHVAQDGRAWPMCGRCNLPVVPAGLGTALKPALEPITVARKPLAGTVAQNVLTHGTGALNIDGCRVGTDGGTKGCDAGPSNGILGDGLNGSFGKPVPGLGRWPANLIHDGSDEVTGLFPGEDTGSAARFFYCAKASKRDRDEGLEAFEAKPGCTMGEGIGHASGADVLRRNNHPTVKPTDLMRYLCRLVTPPGGLVLDPFTGSGSTGKGAVLERFRFVGIEREAEYVEIARARIAAATPEPDPEPAPEADNDNRPDDLLSWAGI